MSADAPQDLRDEQGRLRCRMTVAADGRLDGPLEAWDADGRVIARQTWRAGVLHGPAVTYGPGAGRSDMTYVDGSAEGPITLYGADGRLSATGHLAAGRLDGPMTLYDAKGRAVRRLIHTQGRQTGAEELTLAGKLGKLLGK